MRENIKEEEALYLLQSKQVKGISFKEATFLSSSERSPMEDGWFDIQDEDTNLKIKEHHVEIDLWFNVYSFEETALDKRTIHVENDGLKREIKQVKHRLKIMLRDIDYLLANGTRFTIERPES